MLYYQNMEMSKSEGGQFEFIFWKIFMENAGRGMYLDELSTISRWTPYFSKWLLILGLSKRHNDWL